MNLFKKATASVALVALVSGLFSTGVSAASGAQTDAANTLAAEGIINNHSSDTAAYNLDQNVLRQEIAAVARGVAGLAKSTTVTGVFTDVTATSPNTWAVYSIEPLAEAGIVSTSNATFNPERNISKAEALGMMVSAAGLGYSFDSSKTSSWQEQVVAFAVNEDIVSTFTDYDASATRGWVFKVGADSMETTTDDDDDLLGDLLGDLTDDEEDDTDTTTDTTDDTTTVISGDNVLTVSLSPETPVAATVPGAVNGLPAASFDFTAGSEDVTITQITIKRRGLSDNNTLESLAVFTDTGRASNEKNDNQENDTEAQLNLSDGGVVVKAGETRTLSIVVDLGNVAAAAQDEFALELTSLVANSNIEGLDNLVANTLRIGSVDAPTLTFTQGSSVSNPTLGEENVDIFEFEIDGDNNEDVILKTITFEGSSDAEDDLANFKLYYGNDLVASTASMKDDFLTFDLGDGITIQEDKNEDFTVKADIIEGAADVISFTIDEKLDVTAVSTKFGYGASVVITAFNSTPKTVTIEAGELTIVEIEPDFDEIREDKNNVTIGGFKLTNVAGQNLELQEFGIKVTLTAGNAFVDDGAGGGTANDDTLNGTEALTLAKLFDDVELYNEETGSSYELQLGGTSSDIYSEDSIDVIIPQGSTNWSIRADTGEDINLFDSASFEISFVTGNTNILTAGAFYVEETEDDKEVTDITPSSVSFNSIDGSESGATASEVNLSDITVVRGAKDIVALQWEVEAEESSYVTVDEVIAKINPTAAAAVVAVTAVAQVDTLTITGTSGTAAITTAGVTGSPLTSTFATDLTTTAANFVTANAAAYATAGITLTSAGADLVLTAAVAGTAFTSPSAANATGDLAGSNVATTANVVAVTAQAEVFIFSSTNLPSQTISEARLYVGSVSEANLLDQESGSKIASDGTVTFNDFTDVKIESNATETFIVVLSIVDGQDAVDQRFIETTLTSLSVEDDDKDDVTVTTNILSNRQISITGFGELTITADANNEDNEDAKTILAGSSETVFSVDVQSINESMDVETVVFTVDTDLTEKIVNASLYLDDTLIDTNNIGDVTATTITFDDLDNLIVEESTAELKLVLNTETIGYQKNGATVTGINITNIALNDVQGVDSGKDATNETLAISSSSKDTAIVPILLTASVEASLNSSTTPELKLTSTAGDNTKDNDNSTANTLVDVLVFSTLGTSIAGAEVYTISNTDDSSDTITWVITTSPDIVTFTLAGMTDTNQTISAGSSETFKITITGTADGDTSSLQLLETGVTYSVADNTGATSLTNNMSDELDMGTRSY